MRLKLILLGGLVLLTGCSTSPNRQHGPVDDAAQQQVIVITNVLPDRPIQASSQAEWSKLIAAMAPYVARAQESYPEAKRRYLAGLPPNELLYALARIRDAAGQLEQAFVSVELIQNGHITGQIDSDLRTVQGYKRGDWYAFPEDELVDWIIVRGDGSEEGNVVGKFLDEWERTGH